jgi:hypothetical protein
LAQLMTGPSSLVGINLDIRSRSRINAIVTD